MTAVARRGRAVVILVILAILVVVLVAAVWWWSTRAPDSGEEAFGDVVEVTLPDGLAPVGMDAVPEPFLPLFVDACFSLTETAEAGGLDGLLPTGAGDGQGQVSCAFAAPDIEVAVAIGSTDFEAKVADLAARAPDLAPPEPVRIDGTDGVFIWVEETATLAVAGYDYGLVITITSAALARDEALDLATLLAGSSFSAG